MATGRLTVFEDRLYVDDGEGVQDEGGTVRLQEVAWDPETRTFVDVQPGEPSHNERHHVKDIAVVNGTTEALFDAAGKQVLPGDPHHFEAEHGDAHYDADAPGKTRLQFHDDAVGPTTTAHTEAYSV